MTVARPTFSESWYKVADLHLRPATTVQIHRQQFRGQTWYVAQDASSNAFYRLNAAGYGFIGLLDGRRTVAEAWQICNEMQGDDAPTQSEVIRLLGQLYTSNMLHGELPGDTESLFRRYTQRVQRELRGMFSNLLFIRIPLFDPDHFLNRWVGIFGLIFSWPGAIVIGVILFAGLFQLAGLEEELVDRSSGVLSRENIPWLYVCFVVTKLLHEFGHGFCCKRFGVRNGAGGEVHEMGIMLLVFTPIPYVDASSSWVFRSKWQRAMVASGGMIVEFAVAGLAAVVWANTSESTLTHTLAYNVMFVAGVSTLMFNGNPLLRYDGYYILSDLLEIPNLAQRSRDYLYFLIKRYVWGARNVISPVVRGERLWLFVYAIASTIYRTMISIFILLFVADKLFFVGAILAVVAFVTWVVMPIGKLIRYLANNAELSRVRSWAIYSTTGAAIALFVVISLVPFPDHLRTDGIVEPQRLAVIHVATDGFVRTAAESGQRVDPKNGSLIEADSAELRAKLAMLEQDRERVETRRRWAVRDSDVPSAQVFTEQRDAFDEQIARKRTEFANLTIKAPFDGTWIAPDIERSQGAYFRRGQPVGTVADLDGFIIRATADQFKAALLMTEAAPTVEIRVRTRPDIEVPGLVTEILPAGQEQLPSAALGLAAGGNVEIEASDPSGQKSVEAFFEIRITPDSFDRLFAGQRVVVRHTLTPKPLAYQWWREIAQLFQQRFKI